MLYHLANWLEANYALPGFQIFEFITFRAGAVIVTSLLISMIFGRSIIRFLQRQQIGEVVRDLGLEGQIQKQGTPTMGGVIIILAILVPILLFADLTNIYLQLMVLATVWMGVIGFADDYIKVFRKNKAGISKRTKLVAQGLLGLVIGCVMLLHEDVVVRLPTDDPRIEGYEVINTVTLSDPTSEDVTRSYAYVKTTLTNVPFLKGNELDYASLLTFLGDNANDLVWIIFVPLIIFVMAAVSNAANLTDGLDGLATGVSAIIGAALGVLAYVSGNSVAADYLNILFLPGTSELVVFSAGFLGACLGFLWYNAFPAQVFMGDTGSLTLGSIIAALAILIRKELLIPLLCGIFLIENLSVLIQVYYFKYTRKKYGEGRRIFKMAPLHHHFQKENMHEVKIVVRFWLVGILLAVLTILTLKIR